MIHRNKIEDFVKMSVVCTYIYACSLVYVYIPFTFDIKDRLLYKTGDVTKILIIL